MVEKISLMKKEFLTVVVRVSEELVKTRLEYGLIGLDYLQDVLR